MSGVARARAIASTFAAAIVLFTTAAAAQVPPPVEPQTDPAKLDQARKHMEAGAAFYNDPSGHKCEEALREFTKAYELSGSLNAMRGAGICALELERDGEAIELLDRYVEAKGAAIDAADKKQLDSDLKALKAAVARISFVTDRPQTRIAAVRTPSRGYPITNRYAVAEGTTVLGLHPGSYVITASAAGEKDLTWKVEIANGATLEHAFTWNPAEAPGAALPPAAAPPPGDAGGAEPPPEAPEGGERPIPTTVWIFGGVTVALAVPMTIFMISASGARSDFDAQNGQASAAELEGLRSDVTTMNLVSDVFLGATVASAATTAIFYFTRPTVASDAAQSRSPGLALDGTVLPDTLPRGVHANLVPAIGRQGGGAYVSGTF